VQPMPKYEKNFYIVAIITLAIFIGISWAIKSNNKQVEMVTSLSSNDIVENLNQVKLKLIPTSIENTTEGTTPYFNSPSEILPVNNITNNQLIDISIKEQQVRVYDEKNKLVYTFICSTSLTGILMPPGQHPDVIHDNIGEFTVLDKEKNHWSKKYQCDMPWAIHYHGGHYIHATNKIKELGRPASHGCVRLHPRDAKILYDFTKIRDIIYIH